MVENVPGAITESLHIRIAEVVGVDWALSISDHRPVTLAPRTKSGCSSVEVDVMRLGKIAVRTINPVALKLVLRIAVVEAAEPKSADIGGKGPLTDPHVVFYVLNVA